MFNYLSGPKFKAYFVSDFPLSVDRNPELNAKFVKIIEDVLI